MAGCAAARWYLWIPPPPPPPITCRCAFNAMFRINCVAPSNPGYSVELSPFSRRARSLRLRICTTQPSYANLGLVATSILILIVAPHRGALTSDKRCFCRAPLSRRPCNVARPGRAGSPRVVVFVSSRRMLRHPIAISSMISQ